MSKHYIKPISLQPISWSKSNTYSLNQENYTKIIYWWNSLPQKTVIWDVFSAFDKKPLLRDVLVIESTFVDNLTFCWCKQGLNHWNTLNPQHLALDYLKEELSIITNSENWFLYNHKITILS
ncbi:hypothetical protein Cri9333_4550 [Crinalium epipsammum PCC 9333]|uniref:Uncharacterized protein n=1 Tax=Crinalium epipsammum PCC 9333 TaxID=1173022 RepID=K9W784_9CYAN|nr:hypothetical protein [Crinalium epipsammum]AFZ15330.1 hypothetical protein Cri9333_4550 [Crinalium epipsammum PCC 9333]